MSESKTSQPQIFVIEDDEMLRDTFIDVFEIHGCTVDYAEEGHQALERLRYITPNLIVMDLHLPGLSGHALLLHIKEEPHLKDTRIVLLTADGLRAQALEPDVDQVILKPVSYDKLAELAKSLL